MNNLLCEISINESIHGLPQFVNYFSKSFEENKQKIKKKTVVTLCCR